VELLSGIRNLIRRRKPPLAIDIAEPKPDSAVVEEVDVTEPLEVVEELEALEPGALDVEAVSAPMAESAAEVHGFDVAAAVERICDRLDAQGQRVDAQTSEVRRLVQHLEQLPLVLKETAEIKGQCAQVMELVSGQVSDARTRDEAVVEAVNETRRHEDAVLEAINEARGRNDAVIAAVNETQRRENAVLEAINETRGRNDAVIEAINNAQGHDDAVIEAVNAAVDKAVSAAVKRITEASSRDAETLSHIQQQVESNAQALRMAGETEDGVSQNLREVLESSIRVQRSVAELDKSHEGREAQMAMHFAASKRTMMTLSFACTLAALLALVVAVIALLT
jgi:uncharacterized coiled-coil DUF342 family protein